MDPSEWLQSLGLERYAAAFRENEIDETVLLRLTSEDLKDIGVGPVGHRRKLLDAIAAFRTDAKDEMSAEVASTPSGERRQVTVMFSDLVGSTALSTRMDPEDLREVISAYQKCVADAVQHFDGFVAKYMGDGVLVYFGYPQAHEDDAERAVRAGLELVAAVSGARELCRFGGSGLASMYPTFDWSVAPGHHGYQRACDLITGKASRRPNGSPVLARAGKTEPPSHVVLSQTSAGNSQFFTQTKRLTP
jgi:hypothetical protein